MADPLPERRPGALPGEPDSIERADACDADLPSRVRLVPALDLPPSPLASPEAQPNWTSRLAVRRRGRLQWNTGSATSREARDTDVIHWRRLKRGLQEGRVHDHFTWSEEDELGRGAFGRVFRGKSCYNSTKSVAIKQMSRSSIADVGKLWSEINILADLDHPNILRLLGR